MVHGRDRMVTFHEQEDLVLLDQAGDLASGHVIQL